MATTTKTDDTNNGENTEKLNAHTALTGVDTYGITTWGKPARGTTEVKRAHPTTQHPTPRYTLIKNESTCPSRST